MCWESEDDQLDIELLWNPSSNTKQIYTVTISERPTAANFPIEIQGYNTRSLLDTGASVLCISYDWYGNFVKKSEIEENIHAKGTSADVSD